MDCDIFGARKPLYRNSTYETGGDEVFPRCLLIHCHQTFFNFGKKLQGFQAIWMEKLGQVGLIV